MHFLNLSAIWTRHSWKRAVQVSRRPLNEIYHPSYVAISICSDFRTKVKRYLATLKIIIALFQLFCRLVQPLIPLLTLIPASCARSTPTTTGRWSWRSTWPSCAPSRPAQCRTPGTQFNTTQNVFKNVTKIAKMPF